MTTYSKLQQDARDYYALCAQADQLGVPVSLDDPRSPQTVDALRAAVLPLMDANSSNPLEASIARLRNDDAR